MRKNLKLLFVVVLALVMICSLAACTDGSQYVDKTPDEIGNPSGGEDSSQPSDPTVTSSPLYLSFTFDGEMSSVFHSILVEDFSLSNITYNIVYQYTSGNSSYIGSVVGGKLTEDMIDENCRPLLQQAGSHNIGVSVNVGGRVVRGSFALHLRTSVTEEKVTLSFKLNGGAASFGATTGDVVTVSAVKGMSLNWSEFVSAFRMSKKAYALSAVTYGDNKTFAASSDESVKITLDSDMQFNTVWSADIVSVSFDINAPSGATFDGEDPALEQSLKEQEGLLRYSSKVVRPDNDTFNRYNGYQFAGWFTADGSPWNFNYYVQGESFTLTARWVELSYSTTFYTMGGEFAANITSSTVGNGNSTVLTLDNAARYGYEVVSATVIFDMTSGQPTRIVLSGMKYGVDYSKYVAKVNISKDSDASVVLRLIDLEKAIVKGLTETGSVYTIRQWNTNSIYIEGEKFEFDTKTVNSDVSVFAEWQINDSLAGDALNDYYVNYLFKDSLSLKADGTLRIDLVADPAVSELIIPNTIVYNGVECKVTEIASGAGANSKALSTLNLKNASNLTILGSRAFANCASLVTVIPPDQEGIETIGEDVFIGTAWFNNYKNSHGGKEFIVINKILYAYVGDGEVNIDLSNNNYYTQSNTNGLSDEEIAALNTQLANCNRIAAGCFKNRTSLQTVTLGAKITHIDNYAFRNASALCQINADSATDLSVIGEYAFNGTDLLNSSSQNYNSDMRAIVIGNVFYRFLDTRSSSADIKENITSIAANAFVGATNLAKINFYRAENIKYIGKDALTQTLWVRSNQNSDTDKAYVKDGFVIINGMLACYVDTASVTEITIPGNVTRIIENAFSSYASNLKTIQFGANAITIDDYAFSGATALEHIVLALTEYSSTDHVFVGIPKISINTFADVNGRLLENIKFYAKSAVLDALGTDTEIAGKYPQWKTLHTAYKDRFVVNLDVYVWVNPDAVPSVYYKTEKGQTAASLFGTEFVNGLIIENTAGVRRYETLNVSTHAIIFETKEGQHELKFTPTSGTEHKDKIFKYTVYNAVEDKTAQFNGGTDPIIIDGKSGAIRVNGLLETYYTSQTTLDISGVTLEYTDIDGKLVTVDSSKFTVSRFLPPTQGVARVITITYDFYGIGTYLIEWSYTGVVSKFYSAKQAGVVFMPLNSNPDLYYTSINILFTSEDGSTKQLPLSSNVLNIVSVDGVPTDSLRTNTIGFHTAKIEYISNDAKDGIVEFDLVYSVALEADTTAFVFTTATTTNADGSKVNTASVTRLNNKSLDKVVVPAQYTTRGVTYTVTSIGVEAFKNNTTLTEVYIPSTVTTIGERAFKGCSSIKNIYVYESIKVAPTPLENDSFKVLSETIVNQSVVSLSGITAEGQSSAVLVVPKNITFKQDIPKEGYTSYVTYECVVALKDSSLTSYTGTLWLYDNQENRDFVSKYLSGTAAEKAVVFYNESTPNVPLVNMDWLIFDEDYTNNITSSKVEQTRRLISLGDFDTTLEVIVGAVYNEEKLSEDGNYTINGTYYTTEFSDLTFSGNRISFPDSITSYGKISNNADIIVYNSESNMMFNTRDTFLDFVKIIGKEAFQGCTQLSVDFSKATALEEIGFAAFDHCSAIVEVDLSNSANLVYIEGNAFANCVSLTSVKLPAGITEINNGLFYECIALEMVTCNGKLTYVADDAFYNCVKLASIPEVTVPEPEPEPAPEPEPEPEPQPQPDPEPQPQPEPEGI